MESEPSLIFFTDGIIMDYYKRYSSGFLLCHDQQALEKVLELMELVKEGKKVHDNLKKSMIELLINCIEVKDINKLQRKFVQFFHL